MNYLTKTAIAAGLMAATFSTFAMNKQNHHWDYGFQGAIGSASTDNKYAYQASEAPSDFYSDYEQESNRSSYEKTIGTLGAHMGYEWQHGKNAWEIQLQANAAAGYTEGEHINDEVTANAVIRQRSKPKYQLNLLFNCKHYITADTYVVTGAGLSYLNLEDKLTVLSTKMTSGSETHDFSQSQHIHPLGAVASIGLGYLLSDTSSVDLSINYALYNSKKLNDSQQVYAGEEDKSEYLRHRKTQISMMTLNVGYSHHF